MYRSATYNPFKKSVFLRTWTEYGDRIDAEFDFRPFLYLEKEGSSDGTSIFKTALIKKSFENSLERKRFVDSTSNTRIFHNLGPEQQFLIEMYKEQNNKPEFSQFPLKMFLLDIEVDTTYDPGKFPTPERAAVPINLITVYDTLTKTTHTWGLKEHYTPTLLNCIYHRCKDEQELVLQFVDFWKTDYPDIASGWNCISENEHIWLDTRIVKIKDISKHLENNTLKKYGLNISKYAMTGYKQEYQIINEFGYKINCSADHKIMVHKKDKSKYKNFKSLTENVYEVTAQEILDDNDNDYYVRCHLSQNNNKSQTIKDILLNNFDYFYDHPLFDFYITSLSLRDFLKKIPEFRNEIKFDDYVQGKEFWKGRNCWKLSNCRRFVTKDQIFKYIQEIDILHFSTCKIRREININQNISDNLLQLLGFIFTDGTYDRKRKTITYSSKYESLTEFYTLISLSLIDSKKMTSKSYNCSHNGGGYVKKLSINNIIGLMLPLIYNYDLKKRPNIELISQLSYNQFVALFAGMIDGDGYVDPTALSLCNYDCAKYGFLHDLSELLRWNGAYSRISSDEHVMRVSFDNINQKFITSVASLVNHPTRSDKLKNAKFTNKLNSISKRLLWMFDELNNDIIVKISSCKQTNKLVEMWDLETIDHTFLCNGMLVHNCSGFDFPYIINRFMRLFGDEFVHQLSPVGTVRSRKVFTDMGKETTIWSISGISLIDYMDLYKTFSPGEKESFSLNYISELELGEGKIAYNAVSLSELAQTDWKLFVDYNIQDVHLLVKLEEKLKFLEIARMLSYKGCTNFEAALGKVAIVTGAVAIQASKQGYIIPTFPNKMERESYEGGLVRDPEKGIQKAIVSFDVNSLYPNTIITLNISPETKLGKVIQGDYKTDEEVTIRLMNGGIHKLPSSSFKKFLISEQVSLSQAGVMYSQKTKGVIPNLIDQIYTERVETKAQLSKLKKSGSKDRESMLKLTYYDTLQYTLKILLNSIYGTFANKHSSLMDIDNATSITMTGQSVARAGGYILDEYVKRVYGINTSITKYGDTDSVYVSIQSVIEKLNIPLTAEGKITEEVHEIVNALDEHVNKEILVWARNELFSLDPRYVFKREIISDVGIFLQKKRYILHVLDDEGVAVDKFKYTGIELVRSTTPKKVKKLIENVIKTSLLTQDLKKTNEVYRTSYEDFQQLDPNDIAARTSINNLEKYMDGASLYKYNKGTPSHVKGAIAYNILIKECKIDDKFEAIQSAQKVKKIYCAKNKYGLDTISYVTTLPSEFGIQVDWDKMFLKLVTQPTERLYEAIGWCLPEIGKEVQTDLFELFG